MKKIILITLIFFLQSFPTLGKNIEGKGLFCFDNKGKIQAFYFYEKGYELWIREFTDLDNDGKINIRILWNKEHTIYILNEDNITLHLKVEINDNDGNYYKLNRYDLTLSKYLFHKKDIKESFNCEVLENKKQFLEKIKYENFEFNKQLEEKLKKRKF